MIQITVHPDRVPPAAIGAVNIAAAIGPSPDAVLRGFARAIHAEMPPIAPVELRSGEALVWFRDSGAVRRIEYVASTAERKRHKRKYAVGELSEDTSFYFRGPDRKLNLRAQNLVMFLQLAEGVDDATWLHHLRSGDYSRWFRENIKDPELAQEAADIERDRSLDPRASREKIREAIEHRYTAPA